MLVWSARAAEPSLVPSMLLALVPKHGQGHAGLSPEQRLDLSAGAAWLGFPAKATWIFIRVAKPLSAHKAPNEGMEAPDEGMETPDAR